MLHESVARVEYDAARIDLSTAIVTNLGLLQKNLEPRLTAFLARLASVCRKLHVECCNVWPRRARTRQVGTSALHLQSTNKRLAVDAELIRAICEWYQQDGIALDTSYGGLPVRELAT